MDTTIAPEIPADPTLAPSVRGGNEILKRVMGRAAHPPRAVWRAVRRPGQSPLVELELLDPPDSVTRQFAPEELTDRFELHFKLSGLWGELIQAAFRSSTDRMLEALRGLREEEANREAQLEGA